MSLYYWFSSETFRKPESDDVVTGQMYREPNRREIYNVDLNVCMMILLIWLFSHLFRLFLYFAERGDIYFAVSRPGQIQRARFTSSSESSQWNLSTELSGRVDVRVRGFNFGKAANDIISFSIKGVECSTLRHESSTSLLCASGHPIVTGDGEEVIFISATRLSYLHECWWSAVAQLDIVSLLGKGYGKRSFKIIANLRVRRRHARLISTMNSHDNVTHMLFTDS